MGHLHFPLSNIQSKNPHSILQTTLLLYALHDTFLHIPSMFKPDATILQGGAFCENLIFFIPSVLLTSTNDEDEIPPPRSRNTK